MALPAWAQTAQNVEYGPRPYYLIDRMEEGALKDKLTQCMGQEGETSLFSIGHRGAPISTPQSLQLS
jgi:glycerophosphoryl diester phosphodiesterase